MNSYPLHTSNKKDDDCKDDHDNDIKLKPQEMFEIKIHIKNNEDLALQVWYLVTKTGLRVDMKSQELKVSKNVATFKQCIPQGVLRKGRYMALVKITNHTKNKTRDILELTYAFQIV